MFCKLCKEGRRQKAEGRRQKAEGRRQKAEGRRQIEEGMGVNLTSNVVPIYCLTMIVQIPG
ncbi:hypothetical protein [Microcoleus sp. D2_18a_D3]|uniref:hypothetical protein n=1 Tax=Microcoleus sp. D2_18a_D3 TaxID=3055330 RepID=UPI002FD564A6